MESSPMILKARSSKSFEIIHHTIWGYFSQRSGLLLQIEDTNLVRISKGEDNVFWETSMEYVIKYYKYIKGVNIVHGGKTTVTLFRSDSPKFPRPPRGFPFPLLISMDGRSAIPSETRQAGIVIRSPQATVSLEDRLTAQEVQMTEVLRILRDQGTAISEMAASLTTEPSERQRLYPRLHEGND
ncbi:hypothetical protein Sjap_013381 [Stephania japonica]|uniref:Uncharacterized protein n=1 Tax=Stephania japonica TaxID=461633 RepID=A0AAP0IXW7_9MAGN